VAPRQVHVIRVGGNKKIPAWQAGKSASRENIARGGTKQGDTGVFIEASGAKSRAKVGGRGGRKGCRGGKMLESGGLGGRQCKGKKWQK